MAIFVDVPAIVPYGTLRDHFASMRPTANLSGRAVRRAGNVRKGKPARWTAMLPMEGEAGL